MTGERRRRGAARLASLVAFLAPFATASAQQRQPRVECSLERRQCYLGEPIRYVVKALDVEEASPPDLSPLAADFDCTDLGSTSLNSSSMQIFNGRVTRSEEVGRSFNYLIAPRKTGRLVVPAPKVRSGGVELSGQELPLEVLSPESQDFVRLVIDVSPSEVFPFRPVTVRLRVFVKRAPGAYAREDPVGLLAQLDPPPPMLRVPWVDLADGLRSRTDADTWLGARLTRGSRGGFAINGKAQPRGASFFDPFNERLASFDLEGRPATAEDFAGVPALAELAPRFGDYFVYRLEREVTPARSGSFPFGPATFKGSLIDTLSETRRGAQVTLKELFAVSEPARLVVKEVPVEGRPEGYTGAIGSFALAATVAPRVARVGDPLTLTVTVTGTGNLEELAPPDLAKVESFAASFRVYEATAETRGGARHFTYGIRPQRADVTEVPPVPFSWFDSHPERERYVVAATEPLPIEVSEASRLDETEIVSSGETRRDPASELAARAGGLFAHDGDPRRLGDQRVPWKAHATTAFALPIATLALVGLAGAWRRRRADPAAQRRRGATARARQRTEDAVAAARGGDALAVAKALRAGLVGLVADAANLAEAGLTARETADALAALGVPEDVVAPAREELERWESLRFTGGGVDAGELARTGMERIEAVIAALGRAGRLA